MPHVDASRFARVAAPPRSVRMPIDDPALWAWIVVGLLLLAQLRALVTG